MLDWNLVLLMVGLHAVVIFTPGPDNIIIVSRATSQGLKHALAANFGIVSAGFVTVPTVAFGLNLLNTISPAVWMAVRAAGAIYLIYIGYLMIAAEISKRKSGRHEQTTIKTLKNEPLAAAYIQGLLTNLGNPKMVILLTAFLPQFVAKELGHISTQILFLGTIMYLNGLICFTLIAVAAIAVKMQLVRRFQTPRFLFGADAIAGSAMVGVGVWMLFAPFKFFLSDRSN